MKQSEKEFKGAKFRQLKKTNKVITSIFKEQVIMRIQKPATEAELELSSMYRKGHHINPECNTGSTGRLMSRRRMHCFTPPNEHFNLLINILIKKN